MKRGELLLAGTVLSLFALIVVGAYVAAGDFGEACGSQVPSDWPLCNGNLLPAPQLGQVAEYTHRLLAALSALLLFVTTFLYWRDAPAPLSARRMLAASSLLLIFEIVLGGVVVAKELDAVLVALHQGIAILVFALVVSALTLVRGAH